MSKRGRRDSDMKTLEIPATQSDDSQNVWETETTASASLPAGWDTESTFTGPAPVDWEDQTQAGVSGVEWEPPEPSQSSDEGPATFERPAPFVQEEQKRAARPRPPQSQPDSERTIAGPPVDFKLVPSQRAKRGSSPEAERAPRPSIEVEIRKAPSAAAMRKVGPAYEIWTKNRVYALDARLKCIDVIDLTTGQTDHRHPFLGGQLVGGQLRTADSTELTFPLPLPGSDAMFQTGTPGGHARLMVTSRVTRVMMLVQVVKASHEQVAITLDMIAQSTRDP